jgi:hypothetical protein
MTVNGDGARQCTMLEKQLPAATVAKPSGITPMRNMAKVLKFLLVQRPSLPP